jgi:hypothetical protein
MGLKIYPARGAKSINPVVLNTIHEYFLLQEYNMNSSGHN